MISSIYSFKVINVVIPDRILICWIAASVADTAAVKPNGPRTLLANGLRTFLIKGKPVFSYGPKSLPRNPPNCTI